MFTKLNEFYGDIKFINEDLQKIKLSKLTELSDSQLIELNILVDLADAHPEFKGQGFVKGDDFNFKRLAIINNNIVVGFMTPDLDKDKEYWRTGAIFINPKYRGKGYAATAIKEFFATHRPGRAWIADENFNSQLAFQSAGFKQGKRRNVGDHISDRGHDYYLI